MQKSKAGGIRGRNEIKLAILLIAMTVCILIGALYLYFQGSNPPNPDSLCPQAGALGQVVVLIDQSTEFDFIQKEAFKTYIKKVAEKEVKEGERLTAFILEEDIKQASIPVFDKCNPGDGSTKNQWTENPEKYAKFYKDKYLTEWLNIEKRLIPQSDLKSSPIMEMLQLVSIDGFRKYNITGRKRLIIISDMLQNTPTFSQYRAQVNFEQFKKTDYFQKVRTKFEAVDVELMYLMHSPQLQTRGHAIFWEDYFREMGAKIISVNLIEG